MGIKMRFVEKLTEAERITLRELFKNHPNHRARTRAHAILLSSSGYTMKDIAKIFFVCQLDTISQWFTRWDTIGIVGLFDEFRSGRPEILTLEEKASAIKSVDDNPRSLRLSLGELFANVKKKVSIDTLKRTLKAANYSWRRVRKSLKNKRNEQEFQKAKGEIDILKHRHRSGEIDLRFFDEVGHDLTPPVPYGWQKKGDGIELPSSRSQRINVLGFMNLDSQLESYIFNSSITTDVVVGCMNDFAKKIQKPTYIVIDNAPIHTANLFQDNIEEWSEMDLHIVFLPPYSPELNLIEILWRFVKYQWLSLDAYKSIDDLNKNLDEVLKNIGSKYLITFA
jgi:transposase